MLTRLRAVAVQLVRTEPVRLGQLAGFLVPLAAGLGLDLDRDEILGLIGVVQLVLALWLREGVVSPDTHEAATNEAFEAGATVGYQSAMADGRFTRNEAT
jgi:hypothetical protein